MDKAIVVFFFVDISQKILMDRPDLGIYQFNCWFVLDALARKPEALNRKKWSIIRRIIYPSNKVIVTLYLHITLYYVGFSYLDLSGNHLLN